MNREKPKKSRSAPSDGIIAWLYDLLFSRKNTVTDEMPALPARESIPEHDSGRAEKLFAQMQQESTIPTVQTASSTDTRTTHQDDTGSHHMASASDGGSSSSSGDSDSGSSGCD